MTALTDHRTRTEIQVPATGSMTEFVMTDDGLTVPSLGVRLIDGDHDPDIITDTDVVRVIELSVSLPGGGGVDLHLDAQDTLDVVDAIDAALTPSRPEPSPVKGLNGPTLHCERVDYGAVTIVVTGPGEKVATVHLKVAEADLLTAFLGSYART